LKVAVVEDENRETTSIFEQGFVAIYEDIDGEWKEVDRFQNTVCGAASITAIQTALSDTITRLYGVTIIVASAIPGMAYSVFESEGFGIFFVKNNALDILDSVKKQMLAAIEEQQKKTCEADILQFFECGKKKGDFFLNIQEVLLKNPQLTSKKILLPYLKNGEFNRLDVVCSHVPLWFDKEFGSLRLEYKTMDLSSDKVTIRIVPVHNS